MKWQYKLRGKIVTVYSLEDVVAVQPDEALEKRATTAQIVQHFGGPVLDDSRGGKFGISLPARYRKVLEDAGWVFVEPQAAVARAAVARSSMDAAKAVRPVYLSPSGKPLIGSDLATVQLAPELPEREVLVQLRKNGLRLVRRLGFANNTFEVRLPTRRPLPEIIHQLQEEAAYRFAEPSLLEVITGRLKPTDPDYSRQWQHNNDGSNGGLAGADIRSEAAWDLTRGKGVDRPIRIAVIDNSMQISHPDLKAGITGGGYFQSDGQGGAAFAPLRPGMAGFPSEHHGTFCLGMAGARMNNARGGCGSAPEADLHAIASLPDQVGTQTTLARAIAFAADPSREVATATISEGADVISCSLGPNSADWALTSVLDLAIRFAANQGRSGLGVPIFWAVSNGFAEIARDEVSSHPDVISVGRSNRNDLEDGSAYGPKLDFLAPGVEVYSTTIGGKYTLGTGTSYATPLTAGVAALILTRYPTWTRQQVLDRLRQTCDKVGGVTYDANGHHDEYGYGRINAANAVQ